MKKPKWSNCSERELWEYVGWHLAKRGVNSVLVGGSVVSVYTEGAYKSGDLDIVLENYYTAHNEIETILSEINFYKTGTRGFYQHPKCSHILLEFLAPPVAIGEDYKIKPIERAVENQVIKILSPTDSIKDRLASYIYFNARECLDQALLVAKSQPYILNSIKSWCKSEGSKAIEAYNEFLELLKINET